MEVFGHSLAVQLQGEGRPLLLVHGFPLDSRLWKHQLTALSGSHRVIAPDLRGFGASAQALGSSGSLSMDLLADDLAALLDELGIREPVTYCGLSMGGYIAWSFLRRHRRRLDRLILCDTLAAADPPEAAQKRLENADRALAEGCDFLVEAMLPRLLAETTPQEQPEVVEAVREMILQTPPQTVAAALRAMAQRPDSTPLLSTSDLPVLLICGQDDKVSTVQAMRTMWTACPQGQLVEIPQAGHLAPLEQPAAVNAAIEHFLLPS